MIVIERQDRSWGMAAVINVLFVWLGPLVHRAVGLPADNGNVGSHRLTPPSFATSGCDLHERKIDDIYIYDMTLSTATSKPKKRIIYLPGGGFHGPCMPFQFRGLKKVLKNVPDIAVTLISYPLAPHDPAPKTFPRVLKIYKQLLKEASDRGETVYVAGDSAGGNLAFAITLHDLNNDKDALAPHAIVTQVPLATWRLDILPDRLDYVFTRESSIKLGDSWCAEWSRDDPRVSPLEANVAVLKEREVKVFAFSAGQDMCAPGARLLRIKMQDAGVEGEWLEWANQSHFSAGLWNMGMYDANEQMDWWVECFRK